MRLALLLFSTVGLTYSLVEFTNSALYDIYDFRGGDEVHITKCDFGCLIFAATMGEGFIQYPENLDPYAMNIHIVDNDSGNKISISKLAQQRDKSNKKIPLTITGQGNISVVNVNLPENEWSYWTIVLYVVEKTKAEEFSYEVYDYSYTANTKIVPKSDIVTIMSAYNFRITAEATTLPNSVTARLVGFDNALDTNKDGCPYAYKTPTSSSFPGFTIMSTAQIVSLVIDKRNNQIVLQPDLQFTSVRDFLPDGFITSPGWNGCTKPNNGGIQSFRFAEQLSTDVYILMNNDDENFKVTMDVLPNFDAKHYLAIEQVGTIVQPRVVTGTVAQTQVFPSTHYLSIDFQSMKGDQGFLLRYSSTSLNQKTTTIATETTPTRLPVSPTSPTQPPTTSSALGAFGYALSMVMISLLQ